MQRELRRVCMIAYTGYRYDNRVRREAETLAAQEQYQVLVLVPKAGVSPENYELEGVRVQELNMPQYRGKSKLRYIGSYLEFLVRAFVVCNWLLLRRRVDVFHIHNMPNFLVFAASLGRLTGKPLILDIHDSVPETFTAKFDGNSNTWLFRLLCFEETVSCRLVHKIICVNHPQRDVLISRGIKPSKILVSLNVPDHKLYRQKLPKTPDSEQAGQFKLIYHGTLAKRLGVDIAIQAVGKLVCKIPACRFDIYGEGDDGGEFIQLARDLGLEKRVRFHAPVQLDELFPIIETMDLGVVSNRQNVATDLMLPVKLLEYVALNVPVVAPRLRTVQHYFSDEMVCYFDPDDSDSLAAAILDLYQHRDKRRAQAQQARQFLDRFGWEVHHKDFLALYDNL